MDCCTDYADYEYELEDHPSCSYAHPYRGEDTRNVKGKDKKDKEKDKGE